MRDKKQIMLDELSKEPEMVISTAYLYAKNYVHYGEDVTKAWATAVQQNAILEKAYNNGYSDALKEREERKEGKWLMPDKFYDKNIWRKCSQCNTHFELFSKYIAMNGRAHYIKTEANYCKICGAKMEGEEE